MGNIIQIDYWPTALRDRRRFYLAASPLDTTGLPLQAQHDLSLVVWLSIKNYHQRIYVEDIDVLWCSSQGRIFGGQFGHLMNKMLGVWYG